MPFNRETTMPHDPNDPKAVLGTLYALGQGPPKGFTDKLGSVKVGTPEAYFMLATFCFDLERKLEYLTKVAGRFVEFMPPELAHDILEDTEAINAKGLKWEERAKIAEKIMIGLHRQTGEGAAQALRESANRVGQQK
jgi:hypothetical protein